MTTLTRIYAKLFGSDASLNEIGVFGSAKALNPQRSKSITEIQSLPAYTEGWGSAVVSSDNFPPMEEVTGVLNTLSYQICYLLQEGIPVYNSETEYSNTSIVKVVNGNQVDFYLSQADGNQGKALTNTTWWRRADIVSTREVGVPQITLNPNLILPDNCVWLEGQYWLRSEYPNLFNIYQTTYNLSDDTDDTRFRLPDFREKYICGLDIVNGSTSTQMGYVSAGLPNLQLTTTQDGAHNHGRGTMNITGGFYNLISHVTTSMGSTRGAFYNNYYKGDGLHQLNGTYIDDKHEGIGFDASRTWSGRTETTGSHQHSVNSSNPIVGSSNTVKVDGIKVRVYTRFE